MDNTIPPSVQETRSGPGSEPGRRTLAVQPSESEGGDFSILELVNVVLRNWVLVTLLPVILAAVVVTASLLQPRSYSVDVSFMPYDGRDQSEVASLRAQLGLSLTTSRSGESPQFYADLLTSRAILEPVVASSYTVPTESGTAEASLIELYPVGGDNAVRDAVRLLEDRMSVGLNGATGVVEFSVSASSPALAEQIGLRVVELINEFNLERRQSRAAEERRFISSRLEELQSELQSAEAELQQFLENNRQFENSPRLRFDYDRLQRQVQMRQSIVTDMAQAHEQARIAEVRNTPVITLIEGPEDSARPVARGTVWKGVLALILGGMIALFVAFGDAFVQRLRRRNPGEYAEFRALARGIWTRVRAPLRRAGP